MDKTEALAFLAIIGEQVASQDGDCTAHPIFIVEQRHRLYGFDEQYIDDVAWLHEDETVEADADQELQLEAEYQETDKEPSGWRRSAYVDRFEFVAPFLTRAAAEEFIARQRHNLTDPRVFVDSGHRNTEWKNLRAAVMALGGGEE